MRGNKSLASYQPTAINQLLNEQQVKTERERDELDIRLVNHTVFYLDGANKKSIPALEQLKYSERQIQQQLLVKKTEARARADAEAQARAQAAWAATVRAGKQPGRQSNLSGPSGNAIGIDDQDPY